MTPDEWRDGPGQLLRDARGSRSIRSVAAAAGFDEALWRQMETGRRKLGGTEMVVNPRDGNLEAAAVAVGLDPAALFAAAGRTYTAGPTEAVTLRSLAARVDGLEAKFDLLVSRIERAVDLGELPEPTDAHPATPA